MKSHRSPKYLLFSHGETYLSQDDQKMSVVLRHDILHIHPLRYNTMPRHVPGFLISHACLETILGLSEHENPRYRIMACESPLQMVPSVPIPLPCQSVTLPL